MCEITSKCTVPQLFHTLDDRHCMLYLRNMFRPSDKNRKLNKDRFDVLSIPNHVIKKGPSHGAGHGNTERQRKYYAAHNAAKKARKNGHSWTDS